MEANKVSYTLGEPYLVRWLKQHYADVNFIARPLPPGKHDRTNLLISAINELRDDKSLFEQKTEVAEVWRHLIGKAIVFLKYNDDREMYHDDEDYGVEKLYEFFLEFRKFEPLLYGADEQWYRDHLCHMLGVFIVGEYLVRNCLGGFGKILVGQAKVEPEVSADEKEAMWGVISLTHDLGIALEKLPKINPKAEEMLEKFGSLDMQRLAYPFLRMPLEELTIQFASSDLVESGEGEFLTHVQSKYLLKFSEAYEKRNHGIVSCVVLMKNLVYFLETDWSCDSHKPLDLQDAKQFLIRRNILRSIASHSNDNIYYLRIVEFPFLLRICDELHEQERPRLVEMFERREVGREVTVEDFSEKSVHYKIAFSLEDFPQFASEETVRELGEEVKAEFQAKCQRIRRILRSAVGGEHRELRLTLEVVDNLGASPKVYKLVHTNPETIEVQEPT